MLRELDDGRQRQRGMRKPSGNHIDVQKSDRRADDEGMSRSNRRIVASSVVAAALLLAACGQDDADLAIGTDDPTPATTEVTDLADRAVEDVAPPGLDRAAFDDAQQLFASTVGSDYVVTFDLISQVSANAGPIRVEVIDGRATNVTYPDAMSEQILPQIPMLTVGDFFERARSVLADGGNVEVELDEFYGYPLTMTLDPIPEAIDDEMSIAVQSIETIDVSSEVGY